MKSLVGKIVSVGQTKTIVVDVKKQKLHPLYKKLMTSSKRFKAHCEDSTLKVGDIVKIVSTRPLSKEKHFKVEGKV